MRDGLNGGREGIGKLCMLMSDKPGFCRERREPESARARAKQEKLGPGPPRTPPRHPPFVAICPMTRHPARGVACNSMYTLHQTPITRYRQCSIIDDQPDSLGGSPIHHPSGHSWLLLVHCPPYVVRTACDGHRRADIFHYYEYTYTSNNPSLPNNCHPSHPRASPRSIGWRRLLVHE